MSNTSNLHNFFLNLQNNIQIKKKTFKQKKTIKIIKFVNILISEGLLQGYKNIDNKNIEIYLTYFKNISVITQIIAISTPGKKVYIKNKELYTLINQQEFYILSTSKGFLTHSQAIFQNVGGELICKII